MTDIHIGILVPHSWLIMLFRMQQYWYYIFVCHSTLLPVQLCSCHSCVCCRFTFINWNLVPVTWWIVTVYLLKWWMFRITSVVSIAVVQNVAAVYATVAKGMSSFTLLQNLYCIIFHCYFALRLCVKCFLVEDQQILLKIENIEWWWNV